MRWGVLVFAAIIALIASRFVTFAAYETGGTNDFIATWRAISNKQNMHQDNLTIEYLNPIRRQVVLYLHRAVSFFFQITKESILTGTVSESHLANYSSKTWGNTPQYAQIGLMTP
jgi:hypothetical protein